MTQFLAPILGPMLAQGLTLVLGNGLFAVGVPIAVEALKRNVNFPWLNENSGKVLKYSAGIAAALAAAGIKGKLDIEAGTYVVQGITNAGLGRFAAEVVAQFGLQEVAYRWLIKSRAR